MVPRATDHTTNASQLGRVFRSEESHPGNQYLGNCQEIQTSATQRVQRGTNRPSGKTYRKRPNNAEPRKFRKAKGHHQAWCVAASASAAFGKVAVPKVSSARETNKVILSSGLRQK